MEWNFNLRLQNRVKKRWKWIDTVCDGNNLWVVRILPSRFKVHSYIRVR